MKIIRMAAALLGTLLLAACFPPVTVHPIGGAHTGTDRALLGTWDAVMEEGDTDSDRAIFRFRRMGDGTMRVQIDSPNGKPDDRLVAAITTVKIGDNRFLNAKMLSMGDKEDDDAADQIRGTIPLLYRFEGSTLVLYMPDEKAVKAAIKAGKIAGEVESGDFGDATITADSRTLNAFVASPEGAALFSAKFAVLTKR